MEVGLAKWITPIPHNPSASAISVISTHARHQVVHPTHWPSTSFVLAAGTATFQPGTGKVLLVEDTAQKQPYWFLPRGRKSTGETLEDCALRETFEETGYKPELHNAQTFTRQPVLVATDVFPSHSEAFHIQLIPLPPCRENNKTTMYLAFWYLCTLSESAGRDPDYGKHFVGRHEEGYRSALVTVEHAVHLLSDGRFTYHPSESIEYQGFVLDENGEEVSWDDVAGGDNGGVQALLVARGWEHVCMEEGEGEGEGDEEEIDNKSAMKLTQSVFGSGSEGSTGVGRMDELFVAVDAELTAATK